MNRPLKTRFRCLAVCLSSAVAGALIFASASAQQEQTGMPTDVPLDNPYYDSVADMIGYGVVDWGRNAAVFQGEAFEGEEPVTRYQICELLRRALWVAAAGDYVYVLQGDEVHSYSAGTLTHQTRLTLAP